MHEAIGSVGIDLKLCLDQDELDDVDIAGAIVFLPTGPERIVHSLCADNLREEAGGIGRRDLERGVIHGMSVRW